MEFDTLILHLSAWERFVPQSWNHGTMASWDQADRKVTPCAFLPWVDEVGGRPPDGRRPVVRRPTDGRRTVVRPDVRAARVSSAAPKKKSFDRGGPVWPPRSSAADDHLGGGSGGQSPPSQKPGSD